MRGVALSMMATSQTIEKGPPGGSGRSSRIFYGWWIVVAAFLNLFFSVGVIFYGFPVFYPAFTASLGFARSQVTQGFLLGFLFLGLPCGVLTGAFIDRFGARRVILSGIGLIGFPLILMGQMHKLWQYEVLCLLEVVGYTLSGPISNQVLVARWFHARRGRAMGYAYLGLGLGGVVAPPVMNLLIVHFGWRHALEATGTLILLVLFPVGLWITRSEPEDMGLRPDGLAAAHESGAAQGASWKISAAIRTRNFWLMVAVIPGDRRDQHGDPALHLCHERSGLFEHHRCALHVDPARIEPGGAGTCGLYRRSLQEEKYNGLVLPVACSFDPHPLLRAAAGCGSLFRCDLRLLYGRRLYVDSTCRGRMLWNRFPGQTPGFNHHGLYHRAMAGAVDSRKIL